MPEHEVERGIAGQRRELHVELRAGPEIVGIAERHVVAGRVRHAGVRRARGAAVRLFDQTRGRDEPAGDVGAPVGRAVVDEHQLDVVALGEHALDGFGEVPLAVPERDDRGDGGSRAHVCTACSISCRTVSGTVARSDPSVSS